MLPATRLGRSILPVFGRLTSRTRPSFFSGLFAWPFGDDAFRLGLNSTTQTEMSSSLDFFLTTFIG